MEDQMPDNEKLSGLHPLLKIMRAGHEPSVRSRMESEEALIRYREQQDALCRKMAPLIGVKYRESRRRNIRFLSVTPDNWQRTEHVILYCHGGGYNCGGLGYASVLAGKMARATGRRVVAHGYRLAPEAPYPAAIEDTLEIWETLLKNGYRPENICVAGDSAGGNLALELAVCLKAEEKPLPGSLILMSPWTDMTMTQPSYESCRELDPVLSAEYIEYSRKVYMGGAEDASDPCFSPLYADLTGFPPTLIQVGTYEILYCDSSMLKRRMEEAGVQVIFHEYEGLWHVFQQLPLLHSAAALDEMERFLDSFAR